jgi:hypothetical protein
MTERKWGWFGSLSDAECDGPYSFACVLCFTNIITMMEIKRLKQQIVNLVEDEGAAQHRVVHSSTAAR